MCPRPICNTVRASLFETKLFSHFLANSHLCAKVEAVEPEVDCVLGKMMMRMWKRNMGMRIKKRLKRKMNMRMRKMLKTRMMFTAFLDNSIPGQDYLGHHVLAVGHGRVRGTCCFYLLLSGW